MWSKRKLLGAILLCWILITIIGLSFVSVEILPENISSISPTRKLFGEPNSLRKIGKDELVVYFHIPKTGGSTFSVLLHDVFNGTRNISPHSQFYLQIEDRKRLLQETIESWKSWTLLYAHEDYSISSIIPVPHAMTTILRDPIAHIISIFYSGLSDSRAQFKDDFNSFLANGFAWAPTGPYENVSFLDHQTNWLAGVSPLWPGSFYPASKQKKIMKDRYKAAKKNLQKLAFLGLTNHWNKTMCLFWYTFDIPPQENYQSFLIKQSQYPKLDPRVIATMETLLQKEIQLYKNAETLFFERFGLMKMELLRRNIKDWPEYCYE